MLPLAITLAAKYAPDLIQYLTKSETAGVVAEKVIDIARDVTGHSDPAQAVAAIEAKPELSESFRLAILNNDTEIQRLYLSDVANARDRDVKLTQATGKVNLRANLMLLAVYVGIVALVGVMLWRDIDANTAVGGVILLLVGKLIGNWESAFNFEFGTSKSSRSKDDTISKLTK